MSQLKPCPFCGGNPVVIPHDRDYNGEYLHTIQCGKCYVRFVGKEIEIKQKWQFRIKGDKHEST